MQPTSCISRFCVFDELNGCNFDLLATLSVFFVCASFFVLASTYASTMLRLLTVAVTSVLLVVIHSAAVEHELEVKHTYVSLTTTCQKATPVSGSIDVKSLQDCFAHCDDLDSCNSVDTNGSQCFLKSHCEGTHGSCSGWCGYLRNGTAPSPPPPPPYPPRPSVNTTLRYVSLGSLLRELVQLDE